jgi:hypothetical protein
VTRATVNTGVQVPLSYVVQIEAQEQHSRIMIVLFLIFQGTAILLSMMAALIYTPTISGKGSVLASICYRVCY